LLVSSEAEISPPEVAEELVLEVEEELALEAVDSETLLDETERLVLVEEVDLSCPLDCSEELEKSGKKSQALRTNEARRPMISLLLFFI
jgi:hypothetical protein